MGEIKKISFENIIFNETDGEGNSQVSRLLYKTENKQVRVLIDLDDPARDLIILRTPVFNMSGDKCDFYLRIDPVLPKWIYYRYNGGEKLLEITDRNICTFFYKLLIEGGYL